eukprot:TRINITY_DN7146_c0_g1_i1.p1 TRINITY_DN7146_c0_g1~~TRINITY_DN7146_c0_g1_i1.p1  ORF type:complete len:753 (+),score=118.83 TRINITY_DN7146_c0_g1_i1:124-2259(+)
MSGRNRGGRGTSGDRPASTSLNTGEITPELKKKIDTVQKVAPSWSTEDIIRLLERVNFNEQIAVNDIFDGIAKQPQEWSEVMSKKAKAEQTKAKTQQTRNYRDGNRNPRSNTAPQQRFNRRDEDGGERRSDRGERSERGDRTDRNDRGDRSDRGDRRGTPRNNRQNRENLQTTETGKSEASNLVNTQNGSSLASQTTTDAAGVSQPVTVQTPGPVGTVGQIPVTPYKSATTPTQSWASKASSSTQPPQRVEAVSQVPQVKIQAAPVTSTHTTPTAIAPPTVPLLPVSPVTPHSEPSTSHSFTETVSKNQSSTASVPSSTVASTVTTPTSASASQKSYQPHKQNWKAKDNRSNDVEPIAAPRPATTAVTPPQSNTANTATGHAAFVATVTQQPVRLPAANVQAMGTAFSDNDPFQFGTVRAAIGTPSPVAPGFPAKNQAPAASIAHSNLAPSAPHLNEGSEETYSTSDQDSGYPKMDEHIMHNPGYGFTGHPYLFPPGYYNPESERVNYVEGFYGSQGETSSESKYPAPGFSSFPRDTKFSGETSPQGQTNPQYYPHAPMYYHYPPNQFQFPAASQYYRTPMMYQSGPYRGGYPNTPYNQNPTGYPDDMGAFDKNYPAPGFENGSSATPLQQGQPVQKLQNPSHASTQSKGYSGQAMVEPRDAAHAKNPMTQYTHNHNYNYLQQGYPSPSNYSYPQTGNAYPNTRQGSSTNF